MLQIICARAIWPNRRSLGLFKLGQTKPIHGEMCYPLSSEQILGMRKTERKEWNFLFQPDVSNIHESSSNSRLRPLSWCTCAKGMVCLCVCEDRRRNSYTYTTPENVHNACVYVSLYSRHCTAAPSGYALIFEVVSTAGARASERAGCGIAHEVSASALANKLYASCRCQTKWLYHIQSRWSGKLWACSCVSECVD